jgi:hypothetical protein
MERAAQSLREHFDRESATVVEPMPRPDLVARQAVEQAGRLNRRRQILVSGISLTLTASTAVLGWVTRRHRTRRRER